MGGLCSARMPNTMAKVEYVFPVDKVHGRISKQHKVGFSHRKATKRNFTTVYGVRSTKPGADELLRRDKFADVCRSTRARLINPQQVPIDQAGFAAQKKYATIWGYVFRQEWDKYGEE